MLKKEKIIQEKTAVDPEVKAEYWKVGTITIDIFNQRIYGILAGYPETDSTSFVDRDGYDFEIDIGNQAVQDLIQIVYEGKVNSEFFKDAEEVTP